MPAITMAIQVRRGSLWPSKARANSAVTSGPSAMMTRTLATLVSVSAIMKAVNITDQQTPEIQTMRGERRRLRQTDGAAQDCQDDGHCQRVEKAAPEGDFESSVPNRDGG